MASGPITSWQIEGEKVEAVTDFLFLGSKITADGGCSHEIRRWLSLQKKAIINLDSVLKSRHHLANEDSYSQSYGFFSSHVRMWELDHKEGWVPKNWCFQIVVLEKTLESPTDSKVKPVHPKRNQPWIFIGRTDAEAPILWPPDAKSQLIGKDPDAGKHRKRKEKGAAEDETVREHHRLSARELEQTLGDSGRQGNLACRDVHGLTKSWTRLRDWMTTSRLRMLTPLSCWKKTEEDYFVCCEN